jgi:hypothetical protein
MLLLTRLHTALFSKDGGPLFSHSAATPTRDVDPQLASKKGCLGRDQSLAPQTALFAFSESIKLLN